LIPVDGKRAACLRCPQKIGGQKALAFRVGRQAAEDVGERGVREIDLASAQLL
jgi:hypothetical protein